MYASRAADLIRHSAWRSPGALKALAASARPPLLHGLRLSASVCLALLAAFWLQLDNAHWAATSASIVAQPALGASLRKGRFRAIGTVVGGVAIILLIAAFPQARVRFLASFTLWIAVCGFGATILRNFAGYGAALAGYTAAVVFAGVAQQPEKVFQVALWRITEIGIGIFSAALVHTLTDFGDARHRLARGMSEIGRGIASGLAATLREGMETLELRTARRKLIGRAIELDGIIDQAVGEPSHLRHRRSLLQASLQALFVALSNWRGVGSHLRVRSCSEPDPRLRLALPALEQIAGQDWLAHPEHVRALAREERRQVQEGFRGELSTRLLLYDVGGVLQALEKVASTLATIVQAHGECSPRVRNRPYVADCLPALLNGLRTALAVATAELIWIGTSWPEGPLMIVFTAAVVTLFARHQDGAYFQAMEYAAGGAIAGLLAWFLNLAILPALHSSPFALCVALTAVLLPVGALSAGSWRTIVFASAVTNVMPIVALRNESISDATSVFEATLAVCLGSLVAALFLRLVPPLSPQLRSNRLLRLTLRDLRALLKDSSPFTHDAWLGRTSARLAAMPDSASLEQLAELLSTLAVGEGVLSLLKARGANAGGELLDHAFRSLAAARASEAREWFLRFASQQVAPEDTRGLDAAVQATLVADALQRYDSFYSMAA